MGIDYYKRSRRVRPTNQAQHKRNVARTEMQNWFNTHPSYHIVSEVDYELNELSQEGVVIEDDGSLKDTTGKKKMMTLNRRFSKGDYILYDSILWIVRKTDFDNTVYPRYTLRHCNLSLTYTNDVGRIVSVPCVYESKNPYSPGVDEDKYMKLGDNQRAITIQNNVETLKFKRDQEFELDGLIYRIASLDRLTEPNLLLMILSEYQEGSVETKTYSIDIQENNLSFTVGETRQLNVIVKEDDMIVDKPIVYSSSNESVAIVNSNGLIDAVGNGNCTITASLRDNTSINDSVNIEITSVPVSNIQYRFGSDNVNEIAIYDKASYDFYRYVNNVADSTVFTFELDYNGNSSSIASIDNVSGNTCRVVANTNQIYGTIYLVARETGLERGRIEIKIKSMWG